MMRRIWVSLVCCGLTIALGCQPTETGSVDSEGFGHFVGEVVATWNVDGRKMTLTEDFGYVDSQNRQWIAPAGTTVDGASIPSAFWTFIGGPFEGKYRCASVVHDIECERMTSSWEDVHRMFYEAMRCAGVSDAQAKTMYYAVYHFGPRWEPVEQADFIQGEQEGTIQEIQGSGIPETQGGARTDERVARSKSGRRMRKIQPLPPTQEELDQLQNFIQEENPNIVAIERTTRETLRRRPRRQPRIDENIQQDSAQANPIGVARSNETRAQERSRPNANRDTPNNQPNRNGLANRRSVTPVLDQTERQWVIEKIVNHFSSGSSQQIPASYDVEQSSNEYHVRMQVFSQTDAGELTGYQDEKLLVRVSKAGEVLEVLR